MLTNRTKRLIGVKNQKDPYPHLPLEQAINDHANCERTLKVLADIYTEVVSNIANSLLIEASDRLVKAENFANEAEEYSSGVPLDVKSSLTASIRDIASEVEKLDKRIIKFEDNYTYITSLIQQRRDNLAIAIYVKEQNEDS